MEEIDWHPDEWMHKELRTRKDSEEAEWMVLMDEEAERMKRRHFSSYRMKHHRRRKEYWSSLIGIEAYGLNLRQKDGGWWE